MKMKLAFAMTVLSFTFLAQASQEQLAFGSHFYEMNKKGKSSVAGEKTRNLMVLVNEISKQNNLAPTEFKSKRNSKITKYRTLEFVRDIDGSNNFRVKAYENGNESKIWEKVEIKNTNLVQSLFDDMKRRVDVIGTYASGTMLGTRGGVTYGAKNLAEIKSIALLCKTEIYSDGSGGDTCVTRADEINLAAAGVTFQKHNANGEFDIDKLPFNRSIFKTSKETIGLVKELALIK